MDNVDQILMWLQNIYSIMNTAWVRPELLDEYSIMIFADTKLTDALLRACHEFENVTRNVMPGQAHSEGAEVSACFTTALSDLIHRMREASVDDCCAKVRWNELYFISGVLFQMIRTEYRADHKSDPRWTTVASIGELVKDCGIANPNTFVAVRAQLESNESSSENAC